MAEFGLFSGAALSETFAQKAARQSDERGFALINLIHTGQSAAAVREIENGATVNTRSLGGNWTPLSAAAAMGDMEVTRALLKAKADPLMKDAKGRTAIDVAKERGMKAIQTLLEKTAKQQAKLAKPKAARKKPAAKKSRRKTPAPA